MTIAIVGIGSVGRRHARNLIALGYTDLVLVRTGHGQGGPLDAPLDSLPVVPTLAGAVERGARAAIVANPTSLHVATALEAVRSGCHVLIEKPVSHDPDGLDDLAREASVRDLTVLVGYQYRFHPTLVRAREWLADGAIGALVAAHAHWGEYLPAWHPDEDFRRGYSARTDLGGGVVRTLSHPIDYLRWIGGELDAVAGFTASRAGLGLEVEDTAVAALRFQSGALGSLTLDYAERPGRHTLHLTGAEGRIEWDASTGEARLWRAGADLPETARPPDRFERNDMFVDEMRHFLACCAGDESPRCTLDDGIRALDVAMAIIGNSP